MLFYIIIAILLITGLFFEEKIANLEEKLFKYIKQKMKWFSFSRTENKTAKHYKHIM